MIINYDDEFGGIFELLKSFLLLKICKFYKIDRFSDESLKISKKIFEKEFKKLNTSRSFFAWWADQLVNPYASKTWSLKDILKQANKNNLSLYSTSPIFNDSNYFQWYKNINDYPLSSKNNNRLFYNEWKKSLISIIFGKKHKKLNNIDENVILEIERFSNKISRFILNPKKNDIKLKTPKNFIKIMKKCGNITIANELESLLKLLNNNENPKKLIKFYENTSELKKTWGSLLHYAAFIKE